MKLFQFKKLTVPQSNEKQAVVVIQLWEVRWQSRFGKYSADTQRELECFTSEVEARAFAESLQAAFRLIRHTNGTAVDILKSKSV